MLEFTRSRLGTNSFWHLFGLLLLFAIPWDYFSGIPPCFTPLGFNLIISFSRNSLFPNSGFTVLLLSWGTPYNDEISDLIGGYKSDDSYIEGEDEVTVLFCDEIKNNKEDKYNYVRILKSLSEREKYF